MKFHVAVLLLLCAFVIAEAASKHRPNHKKASLSQKKHLVEIEEKIERLLAEEEALEEELNEENEEYEDDVAEEEDEEDMEEEDQREEEEEDEVQAAYDEDDEGPLIDLCLEKYCGAGRECVVNLQGEAECQCMQECDFEPDDRRRVCSNHNETWNSDCQLHRMRCLCVEEAETCTKEKYAHVHIDYYGSCQEMPECTEDEMKDFPRRMREWLFNIMRDMADRHALSDYYMKLEEEAENDDTKKWTNAVIWKFCELDGHPRDRAVSRHELFPLRAPLYTLEHCIAPFLDSCDADDDHVITLKEWGKCLNLSDEKLEHIEEFCEDLHDD
ncbi:secreted protein, acidic, cysteine-rich [Oratosquilla oratoria]|uniref:secreted protein, acidic, cysteine-rich n=1 Tax=Oratosquilla oratoria TaxID=337810 RepID=UPI003F772BF7